MNPFDYVPSDNVRRVEWGLMLLMIYVFAFEAAPAAQASVHEAKLSDYNKSVRFCGLDPCRVPQPYRGELGLNVTCSGVGAVPDDPANFTTFDGGGGSGG